MRRMPSRSHDFADNADNASALSNRGNQALEIFYQLEISSASKKKFNGAMTASVINLPVAWPDAKVGLLRRVDGPSVMMQ